MAKDWIKKAINKPGALKKYLQKSLLLLLKKTVS